ncbi:MAG: hemolysin [Leptolyngbya foveolarum]|uniref:Hemolysin n=1 Tax=Leptolyngbya foveolarum TaxID=47253 RepID=A0A2W4VZ43_9CYAN|nr:MAG: hemolysin [Leptolyngbya foveolarum]
MQNSPLDQSQNILEDSQPVPTMPLTFQLFTPGSDVAIGFRPDQLVWGRTGNDVVIGYQADTVGSGRSQADILVGDLAIEDPQSRDWEDTFILGDWTRPYYSAPVPDFSNLSLSSLGALDAAIVTDFRPSKDTLQLHGSAQDYQLLNLSAGTALLRTADNQIDLTAFIIGSEQLSLSADYFQFQGNSPHPIELPRLQQLGSAAYDIPLAIATDIEQNVYIAGGTNGDLIKENLGLRDNFIVKYDSQGNELFSLQFGTSEFDTIYGIGTDNEGNFYVTGVTAGNLAGPKQSQDLDTFVAKYNSQGEQTWIRQIGQNVLFNAFNLAVNKETGDVVISGADLKEDGQDDTFVIKFDTNGDRQWTTETGTSGPLSFDESYGLSIADDGSIYAGGWTAGDLDPTDTEGNQGLYDNWLAKYDPTTGEAQWITQYGTPDYEWLWDVDTDSTGAVYTTGWTLGNLAGENQGSYDAYLMKFDSEGTLLWQQQFGTAGDDQAYSLHIDDADRIFVGGYTNSSLAGTNAGSFDAWIARYDQQGQRQWIEQFGTSDRDELYGLTSDNNGNLYATGITQGSTGALNAGSFDGWTAKLDSLSGELLNFGGNRSQSIESAPTSNDFSADEIIEGGLEGSGSPNQIAEVLESDELVLSLDVALDGAIASLQTAIGAFTLGNRVEIGQQMLLDFLGERESAIFQDYIATQVS